MSFTDTIADMLTRIRNAIAVKANAVEMPSSRVKEQVLKILKAEGFVKHYELLKRGSRNFAKVELKYARNGEPLIHEIKRISKPGRRLYSQKQAIPKVKSGYGITILTTNKGIMTGEAARKNGVGGEVICEVW